MNPPAIADLKVTSSTATITAVRAMDLQGAPHDEALGFAPQRIITEYKLGRAGWKPVWIRLLGDGRQQAQFWATRRMRGCPPWAVELAQQAAPELQGRVRWPSKERLGLPSPAVARLAGSAG